MKFAKNILNHQGLYSDNGKIRFIKINSLGHGYYKINNNLHHAINNLAIPFLDYNHVRYRCILNHSTISSHSSHNQLLTLSHVKDGKSIACVRPINTNLYVYISLLGALIYLIEIYSRINIRFKRKLL